MSIRNYLALGGFSANAEILRLESKVARSKLKGIGGNLNKWWNMLFNASILAKPYPLLLFRYSRLKNLRYEFIRKIKRKIK